MLGDSDACLVFAFFLAGDTDTFFWAGVIDTFFLGGDIDTSFLAAGFFLFDDLDCMTTTALLLMLT